MRRRPQDAHRCGMTYIHTTNGAGDPESFRTICGRVDQHAHGLIARYAGVTEQGLAVTSVWESKAHSDRFWVEHLIPTLRDMFGPMDGPPPEVVDFDAFETYVPDGAA